MAFKIKQYIIKKDSDPKTIFNTSKDTSDIKNGKVYALGVQGEPFATFKINNQNQISLGPAGVYEIEFPPEDNVFIQSVQWVDRKGHNLIFDIKYLEGEDTNS